MILTIKYSSSGTEEWIRRYDGFESDDYPFDIEVDNQKDIYVGGYSAGYNNNGWSEDATIVKYDSTGSQVWVARYDGPGNNSDWINGLALDEQDYIYATGFTELYPYNTDYLTIKYPTSGPGVSENLKFITQYSQITLNPNPFQRLVRFDIRIPNVYVQ